MDAAAAQWRKAKSPNYTINVDKHYPYSELPFLGEYKLIRIPTSNQLVEHVDYWGEGRIVVSDGSSGFPDCYNVNRQYQVVSDGGDKGRKIPNRIPTYNEDVCETTSYIKGNSVKLVTLMGAPLVTSCAQDIARMVNSNVGVVVVYGFDRNSAAIQLLGDALHSKLLYFCPKYELPQHLRVTLFDTHLAFLNVTDIIDEIYNAVTGASYDKAVEITQSLNASDGGDVIKDVINKLLQQGIRYTTAYAYKLWDSGSKNIVEKYFPPAFKLIFNDEKIKIESNYYNMDLKLDANVDYYNDRLAWGDKNDHSSNRVSWKLVPIWDNNNVVFKIMNIEHTMFLKLDVNVDSIGDRKCWGSNSSNEVRHTWTLEPKQWDNKVVFFIVNREYGQALKLDAHTDSYDDRLLWGNNTNNDVYGNPRYFGWLFKAW